MDMVAGDFFSCSWFCTAVFYLVLGKLPNIKSSKIWEIFQRGGWIGFRLDVEAEFTNFDLGILHREGVQKIGINVSKVYSPNLGLS